MSDEKFEFIKRIVSDEKYEKENANYLINALSDKNSDIIRLIEKVLKNPKFDINYLHSFIWECSKNQEMQIKQEEFLEELLKREELDTGEAIRLVSTFDIGFGHNKPRLQTADIRFDYINKSLDRKELSVDEICTIMRNIASDDVSVANQGFKVVDLLLKRNDLDHGDLLGEVEYINYQLRGLEKTNEFVKLVEDLVKDERIQTATILQILYKINDDSFEFIRKVCFDKENSIQEKDIAKYLREVFAREKFIDFIEHFTFDKNFPQEYKLQLVASLHAGNIDFAKKLYTEKVLSPKNLASILGNITEQNIKLAEKLIYDKNFVQDDISQVLSKTTKQNIKLAENLCFDEDFPNNKIAEILEVTTQHNLNLAEELVLDKNNSIDAIVPILKYTCRGENKDSVYEFLSDQKTKAWAMQNIASLQDVELVSNLSRTQKTLYREAESKEKADKPIVKKQEIIEAKSDDIQRAELALVEVGVHQKMAPNYVKMCQENGIVDKTKLDAVVALAQVEVPVKEIKNIFALATGSPLSNQNGEFRPDIIRDIVLLKQAGIEDVKLCANLSAVKNMPIILIIINQINCINEDIANRAKELPQDIKEKLAKTNINLDEIIEKALTEPKGGKVNKTIKPETLQLRSLDNIVGVEKIVLNKFKSEVDQSTWGDEKLFREWAEKRLAKVLDFEQNWRVR